MKMCETTSAPSEKNIVQAKGKHTNSSVCNESLVYDYIAVMLSRTMYEHDYIHACTLTLPRL